MTNDITLSFKISLLLLATMGVMSGIAVVSALPLIAEHFSDIENIDLLSKLLLTIPAMLIALFAPLAGMIVDKFGRLKPLYLAITLFVIGGSSGFYLEDFYHILIGRALLGVAVALVMTVGLALVGDHFDEASRQKFLSLKGMAIGIGGIFFIVLGGYLAEEGWHYPFLIYLIPLLFLPLFISSLKEPSHYKHDVIIDKKVFKPELIKVYVTGFFSMLLFYILPIQVPYLIVEAFHGTPTDIGWLIAFSMFINAITAFQYHRLKERLSFQSIFAITYLSFGIGLFIATLSTAFWHLYVASFFMGIGFGLIMVNMNVWLLSLVQPHHRGHAIGILTSSFFTGQFFSPIVFEPLVIYVGITGLFGVVAALSFAVAFVLYLKK